MLKKMGISLESMKRNLPLGIELLPGETIEILETTSAVKLFEATVEGGFTECGGDMSELYNLTDIVNESTILISNYRTCYQPMRNLSKSLISSTSSIVDTHPRTIQIPHLSISQIDETQKNQITITLKFSPLKYLIKCSKPKPNHNGNGLIHNRTTANSLCDEFSFLLKRFIRPSSIENVFAFRMGESEINHNKGSDDGNEGEDKGKKRRQLTKEEKMLEELFGGSNSDEEVDDDFLRRGLDESMYKRIQKLGWSNGYKIQKEFERMRMSKDSWSIASYNDDFSLSPTYPKDFILPSRILKKDATFACESFDTSADDSYEISTALQSSSEFFQKLVKFRKNGRFPIICWKEGHNVLMRSGQPMVSILGWRGLEDELLIKEVLKAISEEQQQHVSKYYSKKTNHNNGSKHRKKFGLQEKCTNTKICILDARSYSAAFSNGLACGGYENCENYPPNTTLQFLGLSNIHAISSSHSALLNAIASHASSPKWFSVLESTGWLGHVADLLRAAGGKDGVVGKIVDEDASVLVHCTDGWDRTTQLVSLAQIMLDPFYRTIKGFQVLIEKEWIAHGHPFRSRNDLPTNLRNNNSLVPPTEERQQPIPVQSAPAPVFLLFLTCVHHLLQQFPLSFEYNDFFLLCLARAAAGNSPYGDFLCNSECEREYVRLRERTKSIWSWVKEHKQLFRNPRYYPKSNDKNNVNTWIDDKWKKEALRPDTGARLITLWTEYYFPKDNFSITLLSIPPGYEIPFPNILVTNSRSCHSSEYALIKLLMKSKERRIAEKVWNIWRSFVLEKKNSRLSSLNQQVGDDDDDIKNDEMDVEMMGSSVWHDINNMEKSNEEEDISNQTKGINNMIEDNAESKFLLVMPPQHKKQPKLSSQPEKSKTNEKSHKMHSPAYLSPSLYLTTSSELLPAKEDYFSEEEQKPVCSVNKEKEEDCSSQQQQQWVYLKDSSQTLAELLEEAQLDDNQLFKGKSKIMVELREAQLENSLLSTTNRTTKKIKRTPSISPSRASRACRTFCTESSCDLISNEINSSNIGVEGELTEYTEFVIV